MHCLLVYEGLPDDERRAKRKHEMAILLNGMLKAEKLILWQKAALQKSFGVLFPNSKDA